jgi:5-methylcytosine-specific restriction protein B
MHIHALLSDQSFEFGHRVFLEANRFAAAHEQAGDGDLYRILDRIVLQKILPKLHGSRRRLETTLLALAQYCFDPDKPAADASRFDPEQSVAADSALRLSFDKVRRMTRRLRANQFTSFTE